MINYWIALGKAVLEDSSEDELTQKNIAKVFEKALPQIRDRAILYNQIQKDGTYKPTQRPIYNKYLSQLRANSGKELTKVQELLKKTNYSKKLCSYCGNIGSIKATGWQIPSLISAEKFPNLNRTASPKYGIQLCKTCRYASFAAYGGLLYWQDNETNSLTIIFPIADSNYLKDILRNIFSADTELESNPKISNIGYLARARGPYGALLLSLAHMHKQMVERKKYFDQKFGFVLQSFKSKGKNIYTVVETITDISPVLQTIGTILIDGQNNVNTLYEKELNAFSPDKKFINALREDWLKSLLIYRQINWKVFEQLLFERIASVQKNKLKKTTMWYAEKIARKVSLEVNNMDSTLYDEINRSGFRLGKKLKEAGENITLVFQLRQKRSLQTFLDTINYFQLKVATKTNNTVQINTGLFISNEKSFDMTRTIFTIGLTNGLFSNIKEGADKNESNE